MIRAAHNKWAVIHILQITKTIIYSTFNSLSNTLNTCLSNIIGRCFIKSIMNIIFGNETYFSLEHQLFNAMTFIASIYITIGAFESYFVGLSDITTTCISLSSIIILSFYYQGRIKRRFKSLIIPIIGFGFSIITMLWLSNAGATGTTLTIMIGLITLLSAFISGAIKKYTIILYFIMLHLFFAVQYYFPNSIIPYEKSSIMVIDKYFTAVSISMILFAVIHFLKSKYNEEKQKVEQVNLLLNEKIAELEKSNTELKTALKDVHTLSGLLPICASCKNIRDDNGYWNQIENYISEHSSADFTHSICPDCAKKLYPDLDITLDDE